MLFELLMFLPVSFLLWTHTKNLVLGLTTNERMSNNKKTKTNDSCFTNCMNMCCNQGNDKDYPTSDYSRTTSNQLDVSLQEQNK